MKNTTGKKIRFWIVSEIARLFGYETYKHIKLPFLSETKATEESSLIKKNEVGDTIIASDDPLDERGWPKDL